jgi:hypothetical protein
MFHVLAYYYYVFLDSVVVATVAVAAVAAD